MYPTKKFFKKHLFAFLFVFILPASCILTPLFSMGYKTLSKELHKEALAAFDFCTAQLDGQFKSCLLITNDLAHSSGSEDKIIFTLYQEMTDNPLLSDVLVCFYDKDRIYTRNSPLDMDTANTQYTLPNLSYDTMESLFTHLTTPTFIPKLHHEDGSYFALGIPLMEGNKQVGCSLFLFEEQTFYESLMKHLDPAAKLYFLDSLDLGASLDAFHIEDFSSIDKKTLLQAFNRLTPNQSSFLIPNNDYVIYGSKPSFYLENVLILGILSQRSVLKPLSILNVILIISALGAILFSLLCSYYITKRNDLPLSKMHYSLSLLKRNCSKLQHEVNQSLPMKQYFFLNQLINGNVCNIPEFVKNCKAVQIDLFSPYHGVVLVKAQTYNFAIDSVLYKTLASMQQVEVHQIYLIRHMHSNIYILLMGTQSDITVSTLSLPEATFYFGSFSKRLSNLPTSYIEARNLSELPTIPKLPHIH